MKHSDTPKLIESYYSYSRPEVRALVPPDARTILDIGCADGSLGKALKQDRNVNITGIELVPEIAARAKENLDRVIIGNIESIVETIPKNHFDCIIMADLLEHLVGPAYVLRHLRDCLKPEGAVVLSIPNVRHWSVIVPLLKGNWEYQESGILDSDHLRFFTKSSLIALLKSAGFSIDKIKPLRTPHSDSHCLPLIATLEKAFGLDNLMEEAFDYQYLVRTNPASSDSRDKTSTSRAFIKVPDNKPRIVFVMRWTQLSGGTLTVFRHINHLVEHGYKIRVISLETQPDFFDLKVPIETVNAFETLPTLYEDIIVVFSILDIPVILRKSTGKLVHFCQGVEAYHYSSSYREMMCEKPLFDQYHQLPCTRIVVSEHLSQFFKTKFNQKTFVVPNFSDLVPHPAEIATNQENSDPYRPLSILYVGRLINVKGIQDLALALRIVHSFHPNMTIHIVTPFPVTPSVQDWLQEIFCCRIVIHSGLDREAMNHLYTSVDLFVNPSWYEGFGMTTLEAMSCGTPVVTAFNYGHSDFCRDEENCLVVPANKPQYLAQAILRILSDHETRNKLIQGGLTTASKYTRNASFSSLETAVSTIHQWEIIPTDYLPSSTKLSQIDPNLVSIVIPTLNQLRYTMMCLDSIFRFTTVPFEVILVDNGSTDGTREYLEHVQHQLPNVRAIFNSTNTGFSHASNQGIFVSRGKYVVLLNNDTLVTKGWAQRLVTASNSHPKVGLVGPMSNYVSGVQLVPNFPDISLDQLPEYSENFARNHAGQYVEVTRLVGFCLLIKREVLVNTGILDEFTFPIGNFEDDDFCLRARLAGYRLLMARNVFIYHFGSRTFKSHVNEFATRLSDNKQRFIKKWSALQQV